VLLSRSVALLQCHLEHPLSLGELFRGLGVGAIDPLHGRGKARSQRRGR
jgi:hypothetical protein